MHRLIHLECKMKNRFAGVLFSVIGIFGCGDPSPGTITEQVNSRIVNEESRFVEGKHYRKISRLPSSKEPQVIKFISYNCPACRFFESTSTLSVSDGVTLERFPVSFSRDNWRQTAKAYATLRSLNLHNEMSWPLFEAVQTNREPIGDKHYFANWVSERTTLSKEEVLSAYDHDKTAELMAMYKAAERRYVVRSVPTVYVNGNIYIDLQAMEGEGQAQKMVFFNQLVDYLISQHG